jgi:DNA-directed RNA polymerase subunit E'/Rpb7
VVPKLPWICTRVKVEVINNKTTWVRVKSTGSKTYLSKKYKVSLKILEVQSKSKSTIVCSVWREWGTSPMDWHTKDTKQSEYTINIYFSDPVEDIRNPLNK